MRTTLSIDPDVFRAAKQLAATESRSLGSVISDLARKGLKGPPRTLKTRNGFALFPVSGDAPIVTPEDIRHAQDEDDEQYGLRSAGR